MVMTAWGMGHQSGTLNSHPDFMAHVEGEKR